MSARLCSRRSFLAGSLALGATLAVGTTGCITYKQAQPPVSRPFPGWVYLSSRSAQAYETAYEHLGLLGTIPCYCGCSRFPAPHRSLADCFVQTDGSVEPHAAFCETCQDETLDAAALLNDGVAWPDIRAQIVEKYESLDGTVPASADQAEPDHPRTG
ncbi:MAG: twin-arginine translocation signal domain-containing protein [Chloroflexi bacterium]|nr:twin-arginine translocation signal domain-containing protein [Chloroflexota bacterium]